MCQGLSVPAYLCLAIERPCICWFSLEDALAAECSQAKVSLLATAEPYTYIIRV